MFAPPCWLVILDSPFYHHSGAGEQMVKERRAAFEKKFGFRSDSVPSREYLTSEVLEKLARFGAFKWELGKPWYGLGWALRPPKARPARTGEVLRPLGDGEGFMIVLYNPGPPGRVTGDCRCRCSLWRPPSKAGKNT